MNISDLTLHNILDTTSQVYHYYIPNYQREYAWKKENWEQLLEDIQENPIGHFMGSLITLKQNTDHGADQIYDVVDGQQRLTTISILLMVLYSKYQTFDEDGSTDRKLIRNLDAFEDYLIRIKQSITSNESSHILDDGFYKFLRVKPTSQNSNLDDYLYLLFDIGILKEEPAYPNNWGNRRFKKAFRFFEKQIETDKTVIEDLLNRIQNLRFILINADDPSMAYRMFETLNNRGVPLSPVDIIKNQILSRLATPDQGKLNDEYAFKKWKKLIQFLPEAIQIRFFRQYYNCYQFEEDHKVKLQTKGLNKATQSNITLAFKNAITQDPNQLLDDLIRRAEIYHKLQNPDKLKDASDALKQSLFDLTRVGAAPAYTSLMVLWEYKVLDETDFNRVVEFYVKYFIRRNLTDIPPTRDLDTIQIDLCKKIFAEISKGISISADWIISQAISGRGEPSSLEVLENSLSGWIYTDNRDIARYLLIKIEETHHNREYKPNLWERNDKGKYLWTIEHVLPQDENIKPGWVKMLANGDEQKAYEIWYNHVDTFGNLSISAYNSKLSNSSFPKKQEKKSVNAHGVKINIGYQNGLHLNNIEFNPGKGSTSLARTSVWNGEHIEARGKVLISKAIELLKFEDE